MFDESATPLFSKSLSVGEGMKGFITQALTPRKRKEGGRVRSPRRRAPRDDNNNNEEGSWTARGRDKSPRVVTVGIILFIWIDIFFFRI